MATKVDMPQMGESVVEGTILTWLKKEGDDVAVDDALVEVSTDKVDTEIPSPVAGTLSKILVQEGDTVEIGTALCEIDEGGASSGAAEKQAAPEEPAAEAEPAEAEKVEEKQEQPPDEQPEPKEPAPEPEKPAAKAPEQKPEPKAAPEPQQERPAASVATEAQVLSPLVRRLAREHNIDTSQVRGTGAGGRITRDATPAFGERGAPPREGRRAAPAAAASRAAPPSVRDGGGERTEAAPLTHIRKRIAEHMRAS